MDDPVERKLAAILAADVVGFSSLMERDEEGTYGLVSRLRREVIEPRLAEQHGRLIKTTGDGFLAEFASSIAALRCAIAIQDNLSSDPGPLRMRIGINLGDVIVEESGDIYGEGVNVAARLEGLCDPGGILISGKIHSEVDGKVEAAFEDRGEQQVKNISRPVRMYAVWPGGMAKMATRATSSTDSKRPQQAPRQTSIAVLPFQNVNGDPEQEYFADGVVEDIITALSRVRWLFVIARNSSFTYKNKPTAPWQVGRELGVRYLLQGSIRKANQQVRISAQLLETATGRHIWADRFDGDLSAIFDLQDQITANVVSAVEPSLRLAEIEQAQRKPTESLDAYDLYLRALPAIDLYTRGGFEQAEGLLRKAVALDPTYADAHAALAECLVRMTVNGWIANKEASTAEASDLARRAIAADPENAAVLSTAAWAYSTLGVRFEQSLDLANRALALHPNSMHVRSFCGWVFHYLGDSLRAIEQFDEARRLNPVDPKSYFPMLGLAAAHFFAGHFNDTVAFTERILGEVPTHNVARRYRAAALAHLGRLDEANAVIADLLKAQPSSNLRSARSTTFRDPRMAELYISGLEKAGLPE